MTEPTPDTGNEPADTDWQAEAEKWKAYARKHEDQAKANATAAKRLAEIEAAQKSAEEKAAEARAAAEKERDAARLELLQMRVATTKGLPADMAGRLRGTTEEELGKDADELLKLLKPTTQQTAARPVPDLRSGALPGPDAQHLSPSAQIDAAIRRAARRGN